MFEIKKLLPPLKNEIPEVGYGNPSKIIEPDPISFSK